jgi:serine/threonine protein phosphatase PrpC
MNEFNTESEEKQANCTSSNQNDKTAKYFNIENNSNGLWKIISSSVMGISHKKTGAPCQDSYEYRVLNNGVLVISVSDGAGSSERSHEASSMLVKESVDLVNNNLKKYFPENEISWEETFKDIFLKLHESVKLIAKENQLSLNVFHSTLVIVVLSEEWTVCGLIGDCAVIALKENGEFYSLSPPQKGEYANATNFITQESFLDHLDVRVYSEKVEGVAVFTDGIIELAMNLSTNKPFEPFFNPLFKFVESVKTQDEGNRLLSDFLNSDRVNSKTDDDKTLVLAKRMTKI